jgi:hypothetical protein
MPIDTTVTAISVESASATVAISSTQATGRGLGAGSSGVGGSKMFPWDMDMFTLRESVSHPCHRLPQMPARVRPDCGEAVEE